MFATVLLWFFLRVHRHLSSQNEKLLSEVATLREHLTALVHAKDVNERLLMQNEKLVQSLRNKDQVFVDLIKMQVEIALSNRPGTTSQADNQHGSH